jgi:His-Xaa-Ser repeat protein HxsA
MSPTQPQKPSADELKMMIMRVQAGLFSRNYDPGAIDGVLSEKTKAAIRKYQGDRHLPVTGTMTTELLSSLGIRAQ